MPEIDASDVKPDLSELLDRAAARESITITRDGVPVTVLGPTPAAGRMTAQEAIAAEHELRKGRHAAQAEIRE